MIFLDIPKRIVNRYFMLIQKPIPSLPLKKFHTVVQTHLVTYVRRTNLRRTQVNQLQP